MRNEISSWKGKRTGHSLKQDEEKEERSAHNKLLSIEKECQQEVVDEMHA
jgi:hypothetical protein